jgi:hypothetical protein
MGDPVFWARFVLAVLATWRLTHLLAREDGPADLIARFRIKLGTGLLGKLMDCFHCLSFWVAAPLALYVCRGLVDRLIVWLAISGAACLLERAGEQPVVIQQLGESSRETKKGEIDNAVLRSEPERASGNARPVTTDDAGTATRG